MNHSRRNFIKTSAIAVAGTYVGTMGFSAKSYGNIIGANDRVRVGIVGYSDRFKSALMPSFMKSQKDLNFDIVGLSDIWNYRRNVGVDYVKSLVGHDLNHAEIMMNFMT